MNALSTALNLVVIHTKTPLLRPNAWISFVFTALVAVQFALLTYITTGDFRCIDHGLDLVAALDLDKKDSNDLFGWVSLTCATQAKSAAWPIFLIKVIGLVCSFIVVLWLADWIAIFNRFDVILRGQTADPRFAPLLGKRPVDPAKPRSEYIRKYRRGLRRFICQKAASLLVIALFVAGGIALEYAYPPVRDLLEPVDIVCSEHLHWTHDRAREFDCRYRSEFTIFVLWIASQALDAILLSLVAGSLVSDSILYRRLDEEFAPASTV